MDTAHGMEGFGTRHCSKTGGDDSIENYGTRCCLKAVGKDDMEGTGTKSQLLFSCHQFSSNTQHKPINKNQARKIQQSQEKFDFGGSFHSWEFDNSKEVLKAQRV